MHCYRCAFYISTLIFKCRPNPCLIIRIKVESLISNIIFQSEKCRSLLSHIFSKLFLCQSMFFSGSCITPILMLQILLRTLPFFSTFYHIAHLNGQQGCQIIYLLFHPYIIYFVVGWNHTCLKIIYIRVCV